VGNSEVCLLGEDQGVIHLDPEISDSAFQLRVVEQELTRAEIACALVDERDLRPAQAVGVIDGWIEPDQSYPVI
jgi:hypothetical protein